MGHDWARGGLGPPLPLAFPHVRYPAIYSEEPGDIDSPPCAPPPPAPPFLLCSGATLRPKGVKCGERDYHYKVLSTRG